MKTQQKQSSFQVNSQNQLLQTSFSSTSLTNLLAFESTDKQYSYKHFQLIIENSAKCENSQKCVFLCCSPSCINSAVLCGASECKCKSLHENCFNNFQIIPFLKYFQAKQKKQNIITQKVQKYIDSLIDKLSEIKDNAIKKLSGSLLNKQQKNIISLVMNKHFNEIKGESLTCIMEKLKNPAQQQKKQKNIALQIINNLKQLGQKFIKDLQGWNSSIQQKNLVYQKSQLFISSLWDTKILTDMNEIKTLNSFMPKLKIKKLKLLYRASQNAFSSHEFFKKCKEISHTLVLIRTQHKKIIGGYTPLAWNRFQKDTQQTDPSKQTFIFSLTQKDKLRLISSQNATVCYTQDYGPVFGKSGSADLAINNEGNKQGKNWVFGSMWFKNQKYKFKDQNSKQLFTGSKQSRFVIEEWQIFEVIF